MKYVIHTSDTDCDGTTYHVHMLEADSLEEARKRAPSNYDVRHVETLSEFQARGVWKRMDAHDQRYFLRHWYQRVGAVWNPWVEDDTIGIPALDSRYDVDV